MDQDSGPVYHRGLLSQLELPRGRTGRCVGWFLSRFNAKLNRIAVDRLGVPPDATVLEVGFGPGMALRLLLDRVPRGRVCGIDPSEVMHRQAARHNRQALASGRLELRPGTAATLPWPDGSFDSVLSVNNILFWSPREGSLEEVLRVLRPGGTFVVGVHTWAIRGTARGPAEPVEGMATELGEALRVAGFEHCSHSVVGVTLGRALLITACRPGPSRS